ncbi:ABC transporter ATP-binding protein [Paenibacillus sp. P25]|nr:ABC transporter ATP-binding protein [Paenibacillus sp. P25]
MPNPNERAREGGQGQPEIPMIMGPGRPGGFGGRGRGPAAKPKNFKGTLRRLWSYLGTEKKWLTLVFSFILVDSALTLAGPYLIGRSVDAMALGGGSVRFPALEAALFALTAAYLADGVLTFLQGWLMAGVSQRIVAGLREALFAKLQKPPLAYFDSRRHGEVMSRLSNDVDNISNTVSQSTTQLMSGVIAIVGSLVMMIVLSPALTLASLITVPLVFLLARTITKKTSVMFKDQQMQLGRLNGHVEETISGIEVVKAFNYEDKAIREFAEVNDKLYEVGLKAQIWSGFLMPSLSVINNIGFAAVAVVGGVLAVKGHITVGVIASFLSYSRQFVRPLNDIANIFNVLQSGVAGAERVFEVLDEEEEPEDSPDAVVLRNPRGHVVFQNVSFGYRPDVPILSNISFEAGEGKQYSARGTDRRGEDDDRWPAHPVL